MGAVTFGRNPRAYYDKVQEVTVSTGRGLSRGGGRPILQGSGNVAPGRVDSLTAGNEFEGLMV